MSDDQYYDISNVEVNRKKLMQYVAMVNSHDPELKMIGEARLIEFSDKYSQMEAATLTRKLNLPQVRDAKARSESINQANEAWKNDLEHEYRVSEIAIIIKDYLINNNFGSYTAKTIKDWIKGTAPEYARKGGRPRKHA